MPNVDWNRVGIVASIVGAVGALAYMLSGKGQGSVTVVPGLAGTGAVGTSPAAALAGAAGTPGTPGQAGAAGVAGPIGVTGSPGAPGTQGIPGTPGRDGTNTATGPDSITPSVADIVNNFVSQFAPPGAGSYAVPYDLQGNLPAYIDGPKRFMQSQAPVPGTNGGGGCGCGGGKKSSSCPNTPGELRFPDGSRTCAATTPGRQVQSMVTCDPGGIARGIQNTAGVFQYLGDAGNSIDFDALNTQFATMIAKIPGPLTIPDYVPPSKFGAS